MRDRGMIKEIGSLAVPSGEKNNKSSRKVEFPYLHAEKTMIDLYQELQ